jgi:DNA-binding Xre family transcriptional regulator
MKISGEKLNVVMAERGLSVQELAQRMGITHASIYSMKKSKAVRSKTVHKLADALRVNVREIIE